MLKVRKFLSEGKKRALNPRSLAEIRDAEAIAVATAINLSKCSNKEQGSSAQEAKTHQNQLTNKRKCNNRDENSSDLALIPCLLQHLAVDEISVVQSMASNNFVTTSMVKQT